MSALLEIRGLRAAWRRDSQWVEVVRGVSLAVGPGEFYGLVGESGCGKSTLALSLLGLLPSSGGRMEGGFWWEGRPVEGRWRQLRGTRIGMVFQDPFSSLNPVFPIGRVFRETLENHGLGRGKDRNGEGMAETIRRALEQVRLPADRVAGAYPHQLSGGMRQRVMIALALLLSPKLLIADEPTSALDATIQKEILELLDRLRREAGIATLFITHNLSLLAGRADRIGVMYAGRIVEEGPAPAVLRHPRHPYAAALLACGRDLSRRMVPTPIPGQVPAPGRIPSGCAFHPRCSRAGPECAAREPEARVAEAEQRFHRCLHPLE